MHIIKLIYSCRSSLRHIRMRTLILLSYILIILPSFIIFTIALNYFIASYKKDLIGFNMKFVNEFNLNMEYSLKEIISASQTITSSNECIQILSKPIQKTQLDKFYDNQTMKSFLLNITSRNFISGVYLYTNDGQYFFSNCNIGIYDVEQTLLNSPWLNSLKPAKNKLCFIPTHQAKQVKNGTPVFSLSKNLIDFSRNNIGLLLIDVRLDMFDNIYKNTDTSNNQTFLVADSTREIIYATDENLVMKALSSPVYHDVFQGDSGYITYSDQNTSYLISYSTSKLCNWKVISILPMKSVISKATSIRNTIILAILLSSLIAILFSAVFSFLITSPINKLTLHTEDVGLGNFNTIRQTGGMKETYLLTQGFNTMVERIKNLLKNEYQLKLLKREAEFKALQNQVNPHFLYNTLESISTLADIEGIPKVSHTCLTLASMLRYSISTGKDISFIRNEVRHLRDYISIIQLRFEDMIKFDVDVEPDLEDYMILKLILQPLVENSINHGFSDLTGKGVVSVRIYRDHEFIRVIVKDNGKGIATDKRDELLSMLQHTTDNLWYNDSKNIGLKNIHLRLVSYYGEGFGITSIESLPGESTAISLIFPAIKKEVISCIKF